MAGPSKFKKRNCPRQPVKFYPFHLLTYYSSYWKGKLLILAIHISILCIVLFKPIASWKHRYHTVIGSLMKRESALGNTFLFYTRSKQLLLLIRKTILYDQ